EVDADLLSLAAHKFGGPPGVGALVVRRGVELEALAPGHQEGGKRGGTVNVAWAEALALALELATRDVAAKAERLSQVRNEFETQVRNLIDGVQVLGGGVPRVPNTSNLTFSGLDGTTLLTALDLEGICASSGAACASGSLTPSHVLRAMGLELKLSQGAVRFSLGNAPEAAEVDHVLRALVRHVPQIRTFAPE
ncbi:MAG TPA: aminotransferase class V-fold PLP-dependent enzyme, partial [Myxococcaceae bacterium]|nr:aminotransferase class V-fold PLP-dependent enzyme [Myxococcaceae bacterium]